MIFNTMKAGKNTDKKADKNVASKPKDAKGTNQGATNGDGHDAKPTPKLQHTLGGGKRKRDPTTIQASDSYFIKRLKTSITRLEDDVQMAEMMESQHNSLKSQLAEYKSELEKSKIELLSAKRSAERWRERAHDVRDDLWTVQNELEQTQTQLKKAVFVPADDEHTILSTFKQLNDRIYTWVMDHLVGTFEGKIVPEEVEAVLKMVSIVPFRKFLTSNSRAMMFFRALVWRFLCTELFDNPFKLWGIDEKFGEVLASIQSGELGGDKDALNAWRGHTGHVLFSCPVNAEKIQSLKEELLHLLKPFLIETDNDNIPSIDSIFEPAVDLAQNMNRFTDRFEIKRKGPSDSDKGSQAYDPKWMCLAGENVDVKRDAVELLISPALVKHTKPKGPNVEECEVIEKAHVCYRTGVSLTRSVEYQRRWGYLAKEKEA